ncbi:sigma-70 family RNA polymerase sigma factor [Aeromicrobium sp. 636]|uniref:RNA polymerase sigma factor n=1 Tax=Aeromicrobium senzhongii TaxID=2663859 RepID=A0A8I0K1I0_9ACTN|nr:MULTISPECIES: RNA polymerase sigma factor [Aeromicrobium]MBC9227556.1 RNA polymerase sigma factor [Aeromicrobium senzhongii]MCQ3999653.1 sigma-70 family RNA polymerase sigma factor [Aeromicrobium sp. 636]
MAGPAQPEAHDAPLSDAALLARARRGDTFAFGTLFDRHVGAVYWQAHRVVGDADEAEDVCQDTFVTAWRRIGDITIADRSILPWLMVTARYTALNTRRKRARRRAVALEHEPVDPDADPSGRLEEAAVAAAIEAAVARLSPIDRRLYELCVDGDLTYEQAAAAVGVTHGAVRNRVSRLRTRLRSDLREERA